MSEFKLVQEENTFPMTSSFVNTFQVFNQNLT
jgi:hypothetical protein